MSRIDKITEKQYAKTTDSLEVMILKALKEMNVPTNGGTCSCDKNQIISDVINNIYPTLHKISYDITIREIEKAIEELLNSINQGQQIDVIEIITYNTSIEDGDNLQIVNIPIEQALDLSEGFVSIYINGMYQIKDINYNELIDENNPQLLIGIDFNEEVLEAGDIITFIWTRNNDNQSNQVEYITYQKIIDINDNKDKISLPIDKILNIDMGEVTVQVNGQYQVLDQNYAFVLSQEDNTKLVGINFYEEILEENDIITIIWKETGLNNFIRSNI